MAAYLIVRNGVVVNKVEYGSETPPLVDAEGNDIVVPVTGLETVGDAFDVPAARSLQFRPTATAALDGRDYLALLFRSLTGVLVDELNTIRQQIVGVASTVFDPANMANNTGTTSGNITVTGAQFGDFVDVAAPYTLNGIVATGYVSSANTVVIRLANSTGGAVNLASGTWQVVVRRQVALPDRTLLQARNAIKAKINAGTVDS